MLPKDNRLKSKEDIKSVKKQGFRCQSSNFGLLILKKEKSPFKVGVIISKKVFRRAVDRNREKRRIMKVVRDYQSKIKDNHWVMFLVKSSIKEVTAKDLEKEILNTFKVSRLLK